MDYTCITCGKLFADASLRNFHETRCKVIGACLVCGVERFTGDEDAFVWPNENDEVQSPICRDCTEERNCTSCESKGIVYGDDAECEACFNNCPDLDAPPSCPMCEGEGALLGELGPATFYRCRACGVDFTC